jgi:hypothetical protein
VALPRLDGIAAGVTSLLVGKQPPAPAAADPIFLALSIAVPAILALQMIGIGWSLAALWRRRTQPARQPRSRWGTALHVVLPPAVSLGWAFAILVLVPWQLGLPWPALLFIFHDLGWALVLSAVIALAWAVVRIALAGAAALRRTSAQDTEKTALLRPATASA